MRSVCAFAPAKLNLYLHVTGRRADGYHILDSLVAFAQVGDQITVTDGPGLSLDITGPFAANVPSGPDNLVLQAAQLLAKHANVPAHAHITLEKNLPIASGIGGGSADAAATLRALVKLWALELSDGLDADMMAAIALKLGADVPVCLEGCAVYMGGIGEDLTRPPPLPPVWGVLVNAGVTLSTPAVFQARQGDFSPPARFFETPADVANLARLLALRRNDLTTPAITMAPVIQDVLHLLESFPECLLARMSGSGATCFGLFATQATATQAAQDVSAGHKNWWVQAVKISDPEPFI